MSAPGRTVEAEQELLLARLVQQLLDTLVQRRPDPFALGRPIPIVGRGHGPGVRREADEPTLPRVPLAYELTDGELALTAQLGGARVADMGVVCPDDNLRGSAALPGEVLNERVERFGHVVVAQVPRRDTSAEHRAVVPRGGLDDLRILRGVEQLVLGDEPIATRVL